jgi:hypothetical protein
MISSAAFCLIRGGQDVFQAKGARPLMMPRSLIDCFQPDWDFVAALERDEQHAAFTHHVVTDEPAPSTSGAIGVPRATTTFSPIDQVLPNEQATRLEFAGGLTARINDHFGIFGQAGYQFTVSPSNVERNAVMGDIGVHYQW